jgi:hypothetical protein
MGAYNGRGRIMGTGSWEEKDHGNRIMRGEESREIYIFFSFFQINLFKK